MVEEILSRNGIEQIICIELIKIHNDKVAAQEFLLEDEGKREIRII